MQFTSKIVPCLWFDSQAEEAAKFYTGIIDTPGCRMFYVADPDGNSVGLHQKKAGR